MKTHTRRSALVPPSLSTLVVAVATALSSLACGPELAGEPDPATRRQGLAAPKLQLARQPAPGNVYLVTLSRDAEGDVPGLASALARAYGGEVVRTFQSALRGFTVTLSGQAALALSRNPAVELVEEDGLITASAIQTAAPWGLDRIDSRSLQQNGLYVYSDNGAGVHAYIIDTGIRRTHSQLSGRIGTGYDAVTSGGMADDCNGHGTHVAGIVGGATYGVAKGAILHPVRVLNCSGSGTTSGVVAGIDWVRANQLSPAVANLSLGGSASTTLDTALQNLIDAGVTVVVAAGNSNADACSYSPSRLADALTVGATTSGDARASYSNYGSCLDLFAPGDSILSAYHSGDTATATLSGTSMASPHVAGAVALYLQGHPTATPSTVSTLIRNAAALNLVGDEGTGSTDRLLNIGFNSISLQAASDQYVVAEGSGGGDVFANRIGVGEWEKLHVVDLNGGALNAGDQVFLQAYNGDYLVAEGGGGGVLNADRTDPGSWETFRIIRLNGPGPIGENDPVALQTINGRYVVAEGGGGGDVNANRTSIGSWETFELRFHGW